MVAVGRGATGVPPGRPRNVPPLWGLLMGESYVIANHTLREFFDPLAFGEANKLRGVLHGRFTTLALGLLVARSKSEKLRSTWAGRWAACDVEIVGEYDFQAWERLHRDYRNVTHFVIAMLATVEPTAVEHFVDLFERESFVAVHVGNAVFHGGAGPMKEALERRLGSGWTKRFKTAAADWPRALENPAECPPVSGPHPLTSD